MKNSEDIQNFKDLIIMLSNKLERLRSECLGLNSAIITLQVQIAAIIHSVDELPAESKKDKSLHSENSSLS
jgi:hypothetical protein